MTAGGYAAALSPHPHGVVVAVWAVPGANRTRIAGLHDSTLRVRVAAPPEGGRANKAIAAYLRRVLGVRVDLLSGATAHRKRFLVRGADPGWLADRLAELAQR